MKVYKVKITRQAKDNLQSIHKYISEDLSAPDASKNILSSPSSLRREASPVRETLIGRFFF